MVNDITLNLVFQPFIMGQSTPNYTAKDISQNMLHDMDQYNDVHLSLEDVASVTTIIQKYQVVVTHIY